MESIEFLKSELKNIHDLLPYLEIKYDYNTLLDTHIVQIMPASVYDEDDRYLSKQIDLRDRFKIIFPEEQILFMTENILIQIEKPLLELNMSKVEVIGAEVLWSEERQILENYVTVFNVMLHDLKQHKHDYYKHSTCAIRTPTLPDNFYEVISSNVKYDSFFDKVKQKITQKKSKISSDIKSELIFY